VSKVALRDIAAYALRDFEAQAEIPSPSWLGSGSASAAFVPQAFMFLDIAARQFNYYTSSMKLHVSISLHAEW